MQSTPTGMPTRTRLLKSNRCNDSSPATVGKDIKARGINNKNQRTNSVDAGESLTSNGMAHQPNQQVSPAMAKPINCPAVQKARLLSGWRLMQALNAAIQP